MPRCIALFFALSCALCAQNRVPNGFAYERILVIVPMVGTGTEDDPVRPMFTARPAEESPFISTNYELSDDGKTALVEFVALDKAAFKEILDTQRAGTREDVKVFERGNATKEEIEQEFRKLKPSYIWNAIAPSISTPYIGPPGCGARWGYLTSIGLISLVGTW